MWNILILHWCHELVMHYVSSEIMNNLFLHTRGQIEIGEIPLIAVQQPNSVDLWKLKISLVIKNCDINVYFNRIDILVVLNYFCFLSYPFLFLISSLLWSKQIFSWVNFFILYRQDICFLYENMFLFHPPPPTHPPPRGQSILFILENGSKTCKQWSYHLSRTCSL